MYSRSLKGFVELRGDGVNRELGAGYGGNETLLAPGAMPTASVVKSGPTLPYRQAHMLAYASEAPGASHTVERRRRPRVDYKYEKDYEKETRILFHMCCGPCSIYPIKELLKETAEVWGFFYNPNIHPLSEFKKRLGAVKTLAGLMSINVICDEAYKPVYFIKNLKASLPAEHAASKVPPVKERCTYCYSSRLEETAKTALEHGFNAYSSSLLYSKYQNHEQIIRLGSEIGERLGISFYYEDFREGWRQGIEYSREMGLYRQKYCGCIYSRIERFSKKSTT